MTQRPTDIIPDAKPPVVLEYASTLETAKVPTTAILLAAVVGALLPALFLSSIPLSLLDSSWPWPVIVGIGLMLLGVVLYRYAGRRARPMRRREFVLTGILLSSMGAAGVCGSVLVQVSSTHCSVSPRTSCSANLRAIGQAMYLYAQSDEDGAFPDDLTKLVKAGEVTLKRFTCPSDLLNAISYHYVPGYGTNSDPTQIILYEDPSNHGGAGGNVLYQDGHTAFIKSPQFKQLIDAITLPDGSPYIPD